MMRAHPLEDYNKLADITISLDDDPDYKKTDALVEYQVIRDGILAFAVDNEVIVNDYNYLEEKYDTRWYRSTDTVLSENPSSNWLSKKKWPLNEELNLHMLRYQQVTPHI